MSSNRPSLVLPMLFVLAAAVFRYLKLTHAIQVPMLENFAPWMALAFTGTLVFSRRVPFWVLPVVLLAVDFAATGAAGVMHKEAVVVYGLFALAAWFGGRMRGQIGLTGALLGVLGCSVAFYVVTNTVSWFTDPGYAKTLGAWLQALTTGLPNLTPTYEFFRRSLLSDVAFSCLLLAAYNTEASFRRAPTIPVLRPAVA